MLLLYHISRRFDIYLLFLLTFSVVSDRPRVFRKNPALRRAFERTFGLEMQIPTHSEEAAFGAALAAMTSAKLKPSLEEAQRLIQYN